MSQNISDQSQFVWITIPFTVQLNKTLKVTSKTPQLLHKPKTTQYMIDPYTHLWATQSSVLQSLHFTSLHSLPVATVDRLVQTLERFEDQMVQEKYLKQTDAHMIFIIAEQTLENLAHYQGHFEISSFWKLSPFLWGGAMSQFLKDHEG